MKLCVALLSFVLSAANTATAFVVVGTPVSSSSSSSLHAEIRGPTTKNEVLEFGWDGTTALGGAVDNSKPARLLDDIRASGETQSEACQLFNANLGECFSIFDRQYSFSCWCQMHISARIIPNRVIDILMCH